MRTKRNRKLGHTDRLRVNKASRKMKQFLFYLKTIGYFHNLISVLLQRQSQLPFWWNTFRPYCASKLRRRRRHSGNRTRRGGGQPKMRSMNLFVKFRKKPCHLFTIEVDVVRFCSQTQNGYRHSLVEWSLERASLRQLRGSQTTTRLDGGREAAFYASSLDF